MTRVGKRVLRGLSIGLCTWVLLLMVTAFQPRCHGQGTNADRKPTPEELQEKIRAAQLQVKEEIQKLRKAYELKGEEEQKTAPSLWEQQSEILKKIDITYDQQNAQIKESLSLEERIAQLKKPLSDGAVPDDLPPPPYSFLLLEELKEQQLDLQIQGEPIRANLAVARDAFQGAKDKLKQEEQTIRRIKEELESDGKPLTSSPRYLLSELSHRLATEEVILANLFLENQRHKDGIHRLQADLLSQKIALIEAGVEFTPAQLEEQILLVEKDAIKVMKQLEKAKAKQELANTRWLNAKKDLANQRFSPDELKKKEQEVETLKAWNDAYDLRVVTLGQQDKYLDDLKKIWQYRYDLFHGRPSVDLPGWKKEAEQTLQQLERAKQLAIIRGADYSNEIASLEKKLESARAESKSTSYLEEKLKAFTIREKEIKKSIENIQKIQREFRKLLHAIKVQEKERRIRETLSTIWIIARHVWQYEITSVEDHPITVGKIINALVLLLAGFLLANFLTVRMGNLLIQRFSINVSAAFAFQQVAYYLLLILVAIFVLNLVRIPLTFFTLIGGALAIGVGFGSQNIVNNFLSGLILMMERPIKIGDIVEVEGVQGTVEWVGARSTRIKTFGNLRLVVPNSILLQNKVINWSLTDDIVRREIVVGVIYGSPVRTVERLLKQAAEEHNLVEHYPQPLVIFGDFGDNALIFTLIIWISLNRTGRAQTNIRLVESDIRFRIDELFRENQLVIAFPQRDVHLDTLKPLEVRIKRE